MLASWMLYALVLGTLIAAAASLAERAARAVGRATRWVWCVGLAASLALPVVLVVLPRPPAPEVTSREVAAVEAPTTWGGEALERIPIGALADAGWIRRLDRPLAIVWAAATGVLLLMGARDAFRLAARRRRWRSVTVDGQPVLLSEDVGPAVAGWHRGAIVLPEWTLGLDGGDRALLLAHEREHLASRDHTLIGVCTIAASCMPWNVPLWWQLRRLRLAVEIDCDARVLRATPDVAGYGRLLLAVVARRARPALAAAFAEPSSSLERRITTMLNRSRTDRWSGVRAGALSLGAGVLLLFACDIPRPVAPIPAGEMPVTALTERMPDYNVSEPVTVELVRRVLAATHPELLTERTGDAWTFFVVADSSGRIRSTGKTKSWAGSTGTGEPGGSRMVMTPLMRGEASLRSAETAPAREPARSGEEVVRMRAGNVTMRAGGDSSAAELRTPDGVRSLRVEPVPLGSGLDRLDPASIISVQVLRQPEGTLGPDRIGVIWIITR